MKEVKELNTQLRNKAINCGLCNQWQKEWKNDWDFEKMANQFYLGLDFYLKTRFMSKEFIKQSFDLDYRRKNGVLVDDKYSLINPKNSILIGDSDGTIRVNGTSSSNIYVTDNSKLKIIGRNRSFVIVHALDNAQIYAEQYDKARLVVIKHSHDAKISTFGNVTLREEYDYLK